MVMEMQQRTKKNEGRKVNNMDASDFLTVLSVFVAIGIVFTFLCIVIIPTGDVGVVTTFGKADGIFDPGLHFKAPFIQGVDHIPTMIQKYETNASSASKDLQNVYATIAVNYRLPPSNDQILRLYNDFRTDYESRIIQPLVQESVKSSTARYTAEELITKRSETKALVEQTLQEKLKKYNIDVVQVSITNFDFSPEFNNAIEQKVVAEQNKLQAQYTLEKKQIDVQMTVAEANASATSEILQAQGDAQAKLIRADAEARAIQTITQSLNPSYIEYYKVNKWDGQVPKIVGSGGTIIDATSVIPSDNQMYEQQVTWQIPSNATSATVVTQTG